MFIPTNTNAFMLWLTDSIKYCTAKKLTRKIPKSDCWKCWKSEEKWRKVKYHSCRMTQIRRNCPGRLSCQSSVPGGGSNIKLQMKFGARWWIICSAIPVFDFQRGMWKANYNLLRSARACGLIENVTCMEVDCFKFRSLFQSMFPFPLWWISINRSEWEIRLTCFLWDAKRHSASKNCLSER